MAAKQDQNPDIIIMFVELQYKYDIPAHRYIFEEDESVSEVVVPFGGHLDDTIPRWPPKSM